MPNGCDVEHRAGPHDVREVVPPPVVGRVQRNDANRKGWRPGKNIQQLSDLTGELGQADGRVLVRPLNPRGRAPAGRELNARTQKAFTQRCLPKWVGGISIPQHSIASSYST
jgi:hypothetical protein